MSNSNMQLEFIRKSLDSLNKNDDFLIINNVILVLASQGQHWDDEITDEKIHQAFDLVERVIRAQQERKTNNNLPATKQSVGK